SKDPADIRDDLEEKHPSAIVTRIVLAAAATAGVLTFALFGAASGVLGASLVLLAGCAAVDLWTRRIPNAFTYPGLALVLIAAALLRDGDPVDAIGGTAAGLAAFLVLNFVS